LVALALKNHGDGDLVVEYPQYTISDIIATTCKMVADDHVYNISPVAASTAGI